MRHKCQNRACRAAARRGEVVHRAKGGQPSALHNNEPHQRRVGTPTLITDVAQALIHVEGEEVLCDSVAQSLFCPPFRQPHRRRAAARPTGDGSGWLLTRITFFIPPHASSRRLPVACSQAIPSPRLHQQPRMRGERWQRGEKAGRREAFAARRAPVACAPRAQGWCNGRGREND
jgi:hypothetical protein